MLDLVLHASLQLVSLHCSTSRYCVISLNEKAKMIWVYVPFVVWTEVHTADEIMYHQRVHLWGGVAEGGGRLAAEPQCYHVPLEEALLQNEGKQQWSPALWCIVWVYACRHSQARGSWQCDGGDDGLCFCCCGGSWRGANRTTTLGWLTTPWAYRRMGLKSWPITGPIGLQDSEKGQSSPVQVWFGFRMTPTHVKCRSYFTCPCAIVVTPSVCLSVRLLSLCVIPIQFT